MLVYIAGPMRGYPLYNFPAFERAAAYFGSLGHAVLSPAEMDIEDGFRPGQQVTPELLSDMMLRDLAAVARCDAVALLDGWEGSRGAELERSFAQFVGKPVHHWRSPYFHEHGIIRDRVCEGHAGGEGAVRPDPPRGDLATGSAV